MDKAFVLIRKTFTYYLTIITLKFSFEKFLLTNSWQLFAGKHINNARAAEARRH